jgi:hypothetical protein
MITLMDIVEWMFYISDTLVARCRVDTLRKAKAAQVN